MTHRLIDSAAVFDASTSSMDGLSCFTHPCCTEGCRCTSRVYCSRRSGTWGTCTRALLKPPPPSTPRQAVPSHQRLMPFIIGGRYCRSFDTQALALCRLILQAIVSASSIIWLLGIGHQAIPLLPHEHPLKGNKGSTEGSATPEQLARCSYATFKHM